MQVHTCNLLQQLLCPLYSFTVTFNDNYSILDRVLACVPIYTPITDVERVGYNFFLEEKIEILKETYLLERKKAPSNSFTVNILKYQKWNICLKIRFSSFPLCAVYLQFQVFLTGQWKYYRRVSLIFFLVTTSSLHSGSHALTVPCNYYRFCVDGTQQAMWWLVV